MNNTLSLSSRWLSAVVMIPLLFVFTVSTAWSGGVGTISVMDVEDVGDAAKIARAKARNRSEDGDGGGSEGASSSGGCSDLNIGNFKGSVGQPVPKNITVVIEGPVIQENKCR